jgi:hypothetical protein
VPSLIVALASTPARPRGHLLRSWSVFVEVVFIEVHEMGWLLSSPECLFLAIYSCRVLVPFVRTLMFSVRFSSWWPCQNGSGRQRLPIVRRCVSVDPPVVHEPPAYTFIQFYTLYGQYGVSNQQCSFSGVAVEAVVPHAVSSTARVGLPSS